MEFGTLIKKNSGDGQRPGNSNRPSRSGWRHVAAWLARGVMTVVGLLFLLPNGFMMNWSGIQKGEGIEFALLMIGLSVIVVLRGGGSLSLDRLFTQSRIRPPQRRLAGDAV